MIPQIYRPNLCENSILLSSILFLFLLLLQIGAMKVHPMKRNLTIREQNLTLMDGNIPHKKKLRRLPHVFSKVLELPLPADADVKVEETSDCFKFVVNVGDGEIEGVGDDVRALAVQIHPGVTKIVIRSGEDGDGDTEEDLLLDRLKIDVWRFRLPALTLPELARAVFIDGKLTVTVPKSGGGGEVGDGLEAWESMGRLVVV